MAGSARSRNAPCFCGSGRKHKQCCLRSLRQARQWRLRGGSCRWRFWEARAPGSATFVGEVAEHRCSGEHVWIARETAHGVTWMIDQDPVSLLELIERLPAGLYDWLFEQTLAAIGGLAPRTDERLEIEPDAGRDGEPALDRDHEPALHERELAAVGLVAELLRLVHASEVLAARLGLDAPDGEPGVSTLERVWPAAA